MSKYSSKANKVVRTGWLTPPHAKSGVSALYMLKNRKGSRKWAILKQDVLQFFKLPSDADEPPTETISLKSYAKANSSTTTKGGDHCIELTPNSSSAEKPLLLYADNNDEMRRWVFALKSVLKDEEVDLGNADKTGWIMLLMGEGMSKTWNRRWVALLDAILYIFNSETEAKPLGVIDFAQYTSARPLVEKGNKREQRFTLEVTSNNMGMQPHFLVFDSEIDLNDWLSVVTALLVKRGDKSGSSTNNAEPDAPGDEELAAKSELLLVPNSTELYHTSSSHADFRALPILRDHFISVWKEIIIGHDAGGNEKWKLIGWGKSVAVHPDGLAIATSNKKKQLNFFDAVTGEPILANNIMYQDFIYSLAWAANTYIVIGSTKDTLVLFSMEGKVVRTLTKHEPFGQLVDAQAIATGITDYTMNVYCVAAVRDDIILASEPAINTIWVADIMKGVILQNIQFESPHDMCVANDSSTVVIDGSRHIGVLKLKRRHKVSTRDKNKEEEDLIVMQLPGRKGVRIDGCDGVIRWKPLAKISPSRRRLLVTDQTGLLWLIELSSAVAPRPFSRSLLPYVHDTLWLSDDAFLALTNAHTLLKVDLQLDAVVFARSVLF